MSNQLVESKSIIDFLKSNKDLLQLKADFKNINT